MANDEVIVDKQILDRIVQLLHGVNNYAVIVYGFLDMDHIDVPRLKKSTNKMCQQLREIRFLFNRLVNKENHVGIIEDDTEPV